jgi:photosystem II stability/assembly factor-like uncharacterized protein
MKMATRIGIGGAIVLVGAGGFLYANRPHDAKTWGLVHETAIEQPAYFAGFLDADYGITTGYSGATYVTHDGGATWAEATNESKCRYGLDIIDADRAWTVGNGGDVRFSADGGMTWSAVTDVPSSGISPFVSFLDDTNGWVANSHNVWATDDRGQSWDDVTTVKGSAIVGIALVNADTGYVLDESANLHVTTDGGATWKVLPIGLPDGVTLSPKAHAALRFDADGNGLIVSSTLTAKLLSMRTDDGGVTWTVDPLDLTAGIGGAYYLSEDDTTLTAFGGTSVRVFQAS